MKKHETIPNEPQENPVRKEGPEVSRPADPHEPGIPHEADERTPDELQPVKSPSEEPPMNPNSF